MKVFYLTTALVMGVLGAVGLATARDFQPQTLNTIFFIGFFPAVTAGLLVGAKSRKAGRS